VSTNAPSGVGWQNIANMAKQALQPSLIPVDLLSFLAD
jgi:hypothetical protein